jgi:hypothetical protein
MKFRLELELENDAMKTAEDIENALTALVKSQRLTRYVGGNRIISKIDGAMILDKNGNTTGKWEIVKDLSAALNAVSDQYWADAHRSD